MRGKIQLLRYLCTQITDEGSCFRVFKNWNHTFCHTANKITRPPEQTPWTWRICAHDLRAPSNSNSLNIVMGKPDEEIRVIVRVEIIALVPEAAGPIPISCADVCKASLRL